MKIYELPPGEFIRNTFAVTKSGRDIASAYIVTSQNMYRIDAGADDQPRLAWSAPYDTIGTTKDGQYELGSGTSPTILGDGKYVAITDNAIPMKVVVYRTDETLGSRRGPGRLPGTGIRRNRAALSNSLIGFRNFADRHEQLRLPVGLANRHDGLPQPAGLCPHRHQPGRSGLLRPPGPIRRSPPPPPPGCRPRPG